MDQERRPSTVMVVDDEDVIRFALRRALVNGGFEVVEASSGRAALALFARGRPDVVLTDIRMPEMSGLELLREIKALSPETEVVMMTAFADVGVAEESLNLGASGVLIKPFPDIGVVVDTVAKSMARARSARGERPGGDAELAAALRQSGLSDEAGLARARAWAAAAGRGLREAMVATGLLSEDDLDLILSNYLETPYVRISPSLLDPDLIAAFPARLARKYRCLPLFRSGEELHLVAAFPIDPAAREAIARELKVVPVFAMGHKRELEEIIDQFYGGAGAGPVSELAERIRDERTPHRGRLLKEWFERVEFLDPLEFKLVAGEDGEMAIELKGRVRPV